MATNVTVIGRTTRVRGRVVGTGDVEVQGFVEGEIAVAGDATVDAHGLVGASIRGRRLIVRGSVKGDLLGEEAVILEDGARVVGDIRAPRVAIAPGALLRGYVETGETTQTSSQATRAAPAGRPILAQPKAALSTAKAAAPPSSRTAVKPATVYGTSAAAPQRGHVPSASTRATGASNASSVVAATSPAAATSAAKGSAANRPALRRPPPPVVPVLKKIKGQIATKKKER